MFQDRLRKKTTKPPGSGSSSLGITDISDQVPEIDGTLAEIDQALRSADELRLLVRIVEQLHRICGC